MCQTYHSVLHIYGVHTSKEAVLSAPALLGNYAPEVDLKRANIYLQHSITLTDDANAASATDVVADARTLLVSFSNGICQLYSWAGKVSIQAHNRDICTLQQCRRGILSTLDALLYKRRWCPRNKPFYTSAVQSRGTIAPLAAHADTTPRQENSRQGEPSRKSRQARLPEPLLTTPDVRSLDSPMPQACRADLLQS